jgi:fructosamine-3-kinase
MTGSGAPFADALARALGEGVATTVRVGGGSINDTYRVTLAGGRHLFVKTHPGDRPTMFQREAEGLEWLRETSTVRVPQVVALADDPTSAVRYLALEWIDSGRPGSDHDEVLGRSLADLHRFGAPGFGLDRDNFIGDLPQVNEPAGTWAEFYATRRLEPLVRLAVERGRLPASARSRFDELHHRLDELVGPPEPPARLHGDLWSGNAVVGSDGRPWLVDPAVYGGHREIDLAMMRLFGGFSASCFAAYQEVHPLAPGHADRVALYQLYPLLVHVVLFGGGYASSLLSALGAYVA